MIVTCLSTFDGSHFLPALIESLKTQSYRGWSLLVRDDGSTDVTPRILERYRKNFPEVVNILNDTDRQLGPAASYSKLLLQTQSSYVMLCDQDDIWSPDKIEKTLAVMQEAEKQHGSATPLLVHTDLKVVDENLQLIADSFWKYQNLSPELGSRLNRLLAQNVVTGCTVMINRALLDIAVPIPEAAAMHDWWLALVAATFGKVIYLDEPMILYRQHGKNSVGAKKWGMSRILHKIKSPDEIRASILSSTSQAQALLDRYNSVMSAEQRDIVEAYANLPYVSRLERIRSVLRYRFYKHGAIRSLGFLVNLLLLE
jgi:glycosyltransferase involved in cell wall biosynthesis